MTRTILSLCDSEVCCVLQCLTLHARLAVAFTCRALHHAAGSSAAAWKHVGRVSIPRSHTNHTSLLAIQKGLLRHARVAMTITPEDYPIACGVPSASRSQPWNGIMIPCTVEHLSIDINIHVDMWAHLAMHPLVQGPVSVLVHNKSLMNVPQHLCQTLPAKLAQFSNLATLELICCGFAEHAWISHCPPTLCPPSVTLLILKDKRLKTNATYPRSIDFVPNLQHLVISSEWEFGNLWMDISFSNLPCLETLYLDCVVFRLPNQSTPLLPDQFASMIMVHTVTIGDFYPFKDGRIVGCGKNVLHDMFARMPALTHLRILVRTHAYENLIIKKTHLNPLLQCNAKLHITLLFGYECNGHLRDAMIKEWKLEPRVSHMSLGDV